MRYRHVTGWLILLAVGALLVGCRGESDSKRDGEMPADTDAQTGASEGDATDPSANNDPSDDGAVSKADPEADTPRQAVLNLAAALQTGDEDAFMRLVHNAEKRSRLAEAMFHFGNATTTIRDAVRGMDDEDMWLAILDHSQDFDLFHPLGGDGWREHLTIRETADDLAEARIGADDTDPLVLRKIDGHWRIDLFAALDAKTDDQIERTRAAIDEMTRRVEGVADLIHTTQSQRRAAARRAQEYQDYRETGVLKTGLSAQLIAEETKNELLNTFTRGRNWLGDVIAPDEDGGAESPK